VAVDLHRLVDLAYSAAVEDDLWREWTFELVEQTGSPGALFWVIDSQRLDMCENHMCFRDADNAAVAGEYLAGPVRDDPQMTRVCTIKRSEIYRDVDHVDYSNARTSAYMDWQEGVVGSRHHITASVVLTDGVEAGVSLHRSRAQGPADSELQAQMNALFPEFGRALRLGFRNSEAVHEAWWDGLAGAGDEARVLLTRGGRVLRANAAAEVICERNDGLFLKGGRLEASDVRSGDALLKACLHACDPACGRGSSLAVRRTGGRSPYLISIYPLVERRRFLAPFGATALVCITDPSARFEGLTEQQRAMLGLTPREARLAELLRNGHSVISAAEMMEITYNTARIHLAALFRKTNTTRQAELALFLERLS